MKTTFAVWLATVGLAFYLASGHSWKWVIIVAAATIFASCFWVLIFRNALKVRKENNNVHP
jgi:hypothetical protein